MGVGDQIIWECETNFALKILQRTTNIMPDANIDA